MNIMRGRARSAFSHTTALIAGVVLTGFGTAIFAWTGPAQSPPSGNVSAPINVGTSDQVKDGGLGVNSLAVYGSAILYGSSQYLNFGTVSGVTGYGFRENAGTIEVKKSSGSWLPIGNATAFLPGYAAWSAYGTGDGGAAIYNDSGTYKKLMVVGNNSAGGAREVGVWDNLTVNGNATAVAFIYSSDRRLKDDIGPFVDSKKILSLEPKMFVWKSNGKKDIGLIAQDVEKAFPEFVHTTADGYKAVDYAKLIVPLLGVVRSQQQEIDQLKARLDAAGI